MRLIDQLLSTQVTAVTTALPPFAIEKRTSWDFRVEPVSSRSMAFLYLTIHRRRLQSLCAALA